MICYTEGQPCLFITFLALTYTNFRFILTCLLSQAGNKDFKVAINNSGSRM